MVVIGAFLWFRQASGWLLYKQCKNCTMYSHCLALLVASFEERSSQQDVSDFYIIIYFFCGLPVEYCSHLYRRLSLPVVGPATMSDEEEEEEECILVFFAYFSASCCLFLATLAVFVSAVSSSPKEEGEARRPVFCSTSCREATFLCSKSCVSDHSMGKRRLCCARLTATYLSYNIIIY